MKKISVFAGLFIIASCAKRNFGDVKVINGLPTTLGKYPAVFMVGIGNSLCTATFISKSVLITAAHCLCDQPAKKRFTLAQEGEKAEGMVYTAVEFDFHPKHLCGKKDANQNDIAVMRIENSISGFDPMRLASSFLKSGEKVTLVGFGNSRERNQSGLGAGVKREGSNVFKGEMDDQLYVFSHPSVSDNKSSQGQNVQAGSGDSGGPLIVNGNTVAGIVSASTLTGGSDKSYFANVASIENREFLSRKVRMGWNIPHACCSCKKEFFSSKRFFDNEKVGEKENATEIALGTFENQSTACQNLEFTKVFFEDAKAPSANYRLSSCVVEEETVCVREFKIKM